MMTKTTEADENSRKILSSITEYYEDLCRYIDGDMAGVPSWLSREKCILGTCDSLISFIKNIRQQYED